MKTTMKILSWAFCCIVFMGCGGSDGDEPALVEDGSLVLKASTETITNSRFDEVSFTVAYNGKDVTAAAKIKENVTGVFVKGAAFTSENIGTYEFVASYDGKSSKPVNVEVIKDALFKKHLLMQEFTSNTCGNCVAMVNNINYYQSLYPERIEVMAYHGTMDEKHPDPMRVHAYMDVLTTAFNLHGYPTVVIDQAKVWSMSEAGADIDVKDYINKPGTVGIGISTKQDGNKLSIDVKVKATEIFEHQCRVAVVMVENKLISPQLEYYMDNGRKERWIEDFEHNHVVRVYLTDIWGDMQEKGAIGRGKEWTKTYTYNFPDNSQIPEEIDKRKPENMEVVVFVTNAENNQVLNSRIVKVGEQVDYEYEQ